MLRRKNEAPLNLPPDHPVRRLFQRFRQQREARLAAERASQGEQDVERGPVSLQLTAMHEISAPTSIVTVTESTAAASSSSRTSCRAKPQTPVAPNGNCSGSKPPEPANIKGWGRFKEATVKSDLSWSPVSKAESMETLPDRTKSQDKLSLKKINSCDSGITKSDLRLDSMGTDGTARTPQDRSPVQHDGRQAFCPIPEHSLQACFTELKQDLRGDIHSLSSRMSALENQLADILRLLKARKSSESSPLYDISRPESPDSEKDDNTFS